MKNFIVGAIVVVLFLVGIGFYQGWFVFSSGKSSDSNKVDVRVSVDPDKVQSDARKVTQ